MIKTSSVPPLRGSMLSFNFPGLPAWANSFRAYGACALAAL